jgi:hypothetical protein
MPFFTDLQLGLKTKIAIDSPIGKISPKPNSHKGSWSRLLKGQMNYCGYENVKVLEDDEPWDDYEVIVLEHGMEFNGKSFNLYGGWGEDLINRMSRLQTAIQAGKKIVSADQPMPDFGSLYERKDTPVDDVQPCLVFYKWFSETAPWFDHVFFSDKVVVGDSHALSMANPMKQIQRHDGKTLHGALNVEGVGLEDLLEPYHKNVTFYFGNIDIRHHIMRQPSPEKAITDLVMGYTCQIKEMLDYDPEMKFEIIHSLPIESIERKLPKTGYYEGTPYYGTWEQRKWASEAFNYYLDYYSQMEGTFTTYRHPPCYLNVLGELSFSVMEAGGSVHLSRDFYRYDFETGKPNEKLVLGNVQRKKL